MPKLDTSTWASSLLFTWFKNASFLNASLYWFFVHEPKYSCRSLSFAFRDGWSCLYELMDLTEISRRCSISSKTHRWQSLGNQLCDWSSSVYPSKTTKCILFPHSGLLKNCLNSSLLLAISPEALFPSAKRTNDGTSCRLRKIHVITWQGSSKVHVNAKVAKDFPTPGGPITQRTQEFVMTFSWRTWNRFSTSGRIIRILSLSSRILESVRYLRGTKRHFIPGLYEIGGKNW